MSDKLTMKSEDLEEERYMHLNMRTKNNIAAGAFLLPSILGLLAFSLVPIIYSFILSFTQWDIIGAPPKFTGIDNYRQILTTREFWDSFVHTLYFIAVYIPLILVASISVANLLNNNYPGIRMYRVFYFIPVLTSWVAGALIWKWLLSPQYGPINQLLGFVGITGPGWLQDENWAMPGIALASVWKDMGFFGLIFLGGLQAINPTYYEAADIDGANRWEKFKNITLPLLSPTTFFIIIISIINSFQLFPQVMIMTTDAGPHGATQVMVERIYRIAFRHYKMGYSSAFSWLLFAIIFSVTMIQIKLQKRWVKYDA